MPKFMKRSEIESHRRELTHLVGLGISGEVGAFHNLVEKIRTFNLLQWQEAISSDDQDIEVQKNIEHLVDLLLPLSEAVEVDFSTASSADQADFLFALNLLADNAYNFARILLRDDLPEDLDTGLQSLNSAAKIYEMLSHLKDSHWITLSQIAKAECEVLRAELIGKMEYIELKQHPMQLMEKLEACLFKDPMDTITCLSTIASQTGHRSETPDYLSVAYKAHWCLANAYKAMGNNEQALRQYFSAYVELTLLRRSKDFSQSDLKELANEMCELKTLIYNKRDLLAGLTLLRLGKKTYDDDEIRGIDELVDILSPLEFIARENPELTEVYEWCFILANQLQHKAKHHQHIGEYDSAMMCFKRSTVICESLLGKYSAATSLIRKIIFENSEQVSACVRSTDDKKRELKHTTESSFFSNRKRKSAFSPIAIDETSSHAAGGRAEPTSCGSSGPFFSAKATAVTEPMMVRATDADDRMDEESSEMMRTMPPKKWARFGTGVC